MLVEDAPAGIVHEVIRAAAMIWYFTGAFSLLGLVNELSDERKLDVLLLAAVLGTTSLWLGRQLWRAPSLPAVIISGCVGAFIVLIWLVGFVQNGLGGSPWSLVVPLLAGAAAALPLAARTSGR